jgi:mRNA interferase MazF
MRRGDVFLVDFEPIHGAEANKTRPAVIVSNDAANRAAERAGRGVVTVAPITSQGSRVYAFQVPLSAGEAGLRVASKIQTEQVRAVTVTRFGRRLGSLSPAGITALDAALRLHLGL